MANSARHRGVHTPTLDRRRYSRIGLKTDGTHLVLIRAEDRNMVLRPDMDSAPHLEMRGRHQ